MFSDSTLKNRMFVGGVVFGTAGVKALLSMRRKSIYKLLHAAGKDML